MPMCDTISDSLYHRNIILGCTSTSTPNGLKDSLKYGHLF